MGDLYSTNERSDAPDQASHQAGFFHVITKEVSTWQMKNSA